MSWNKTHSKSLEEKVKRLKEANSELREQIKLLQSNSCLKAKDELTQDIKEAYELKSIAYDLLLEAIQLKDKEIEKLKKQYHQCLDDYIKCAERKEQQ